MPITSDPNGSSSSYGSYDRRSGESFVSRSSTPTSPYPTPQSSEKHSKPMVEYIECDEDLSPGTSINYRSSVETYASTCASDEDIPLEREELIDDNDQDYIPPLPLYYHEITEPNTRPSTPKDFAQLFPSLNRLSIRHDDFTTDGNMNLRVDTIIPGRRRTAVQLFHLRMHDLAKRDFSLRRYCRESGREVCNSKRIYSHTPSHNRPGLQRSMSSAMKTFTKPQFKRAGSMSSAMSTIEKRPGTSWSYDTNPDAASLSASVPSDEQKKSQPRPTNAIKLEFANYARVDVERKGSKSKNNKRYEFQWWGHNYAWKRVVEKHLNGVVSFHLIRDSEPTPVAHIVPETRSPNQVAADDEAGGWIPPCFMWLNDKSVVDAATDVADVIVATGLMALVDDCIKERWQTKKVHHLPVLGDVEYVGPRAFMQRVFSQRRHSSDNHQQQTSPLRYSNAISAH